MYEAQKVGDSETRFEAIVYLALLYDQAGQQDKAYELLRHTPYVEATSNPQACSSQYYYRLLSIYYATISHSYDSAIYYAQQAIDLDRRLYPHNQVHVLIDMANLAESLMLQGDSTTALQVLNQVKAMPQSNYQIYLCQIYYLNSLLTHDIDSSYHYALIGSQVSAKYASHDNEIACLKQLCRIDSMRCNIDAYITHRRAADSCIQELQGSKVAYKIAAIEEQSKIDHIAQRNEKKHLFALMCIILLMVTVTALIVVLRLTRRRWHDEQRLAEAANQREMLEKELLRMRMLKNEAKLEEAHRNNVSMAELITEMHQSIPDDSQSLFTLETTLKSQYADWLHDVHQRYPELTDSDVRLMGFIKMQVQPKVIAMALNISMRSLNTARYRLRKKLKLQNSINLNDFISSI